MTKEFYCEICGKRLENNKNICDKHAEQIKLWGFPLDTNPRTEYDPNEIIYYEDYAEIGWYGWMGSFNGRFFSGGYSGHDVLQKNGKTRDYIKEQINNTLKSIPKLKNVNFTSDDYFNVDIPEGSIVYCDIPYKGSKQYETSKDFDYEKFYEWCRKNKSKYQIFISEYNMPEDFKCIWQKEVTNSMNTTKTYKPIEKLFILE